METKRVSIAAKREFERVNGVNIATTIVRTTKEGIREEKSNVNNIFYDPLSIFIYVGCNNNNMVASIVYAGFKEETSIEITVVTRGNKDQESAINFRHNKRNIKLKLKRKRNKHALHKIRHQRRMK
jgi:hypothetical protein